MPFPGYHIILSFPIPATLDLQCNETDIRLVDGQTPADGRVEICLYGLWRSVCDDGWGINDARVVCQQLGYDGREFFLLHFYTVSYYHSTLATFLLRNFYSVSSVFYLGDADCRGNESMLSDCNHGEIGVQNCYRNYAAGVICNSEFFA